MVTRQPDFSHAAETHLQLPHATKGSIRICSLGALPCMGEGWGRPAQSQYPWCKWSSPLFCPGSSSLLLDCARGLHAASCTFKWCQESLSYYHLVQVESGPFSEPFVSEEQYLAPQASNRLSGRVQQEQKWGLGPEKNILQRQVKLGSVPGSAFADIWIWCTAAMLLWISSITTINNSRNGKWC